MRSTSQRCDTEYLCSTEPLGVLSLLSLALGAHPELHGVTESAVIWADDVRRDANPANGELVMPLR